MLVEIPLQLDMFSGELKDTRTRTQKQYDKQLTLPQQAEMFSQRELAQYVNPNPKMPFHPHETLVLVSEDPRTPEEIARDQERAIEAQTQRLFGEHPELYEPASIEETVVPAGTPDNDVVADAPKDEKTAGNDPPKKDETKTAIYLELVQLCEDDAQTIWIDPHYAGAYLRQIALTVLKAQAVGLTADEIGSALQIGRFHGTARKRRFHPKAELPTPKQEGSPKTPTFMKGSHTLFLSEPHLGTVMAKSIF